MIIIYDPGTAGPPLPPPSPPMFPPYSEWLTVSCPPLWRGCGGAHAFIPPGGVAVVVVTISYPPCGVAVALAMVSSTPCGVAVVVGMVSSSRCGVAVVDSGFIHPWFHTPPVVWLWWW